MSRIFSVFGRAVLALNRVGDELYMEPNVEGVSFSRVSDIPCLAGLETWGVLSESC